MHRSLHSLKPNASLISFLLYFIDIIDDISFSDFLLDRIPYITLHISRFFLPYSLISNEKREIRRGGKEIFKKSVHAITEMRRKGPPNSPRLWLMVMQSLFIFKAQ